MDRRLASCLDVLRQALTVASVLAVGVLNSGCLLDSTAEGVASSKHVCTASLRSEAGEVEVISSTDERFSSQALLVRVGCGAIESEAEVDEYWRKLIGSVVGSDRVEGTDPYFTERGEWCVGHTRCDELAGVPESEPCPDPLPEEAMPEICRPEDGCLILDPPADPLEPTFQSRVRFGSQDVESTSRPFSVTISNDVCGDVVQIVADGEVGGRDPEHFTSSANTCLPDNPNGHALAPGDSCQLSFTFSPRANGNFGANSSFNRDGSERYTIALRGEGLGGTVEAPERVCLGELEGPRAECGGGNGTAPVSATVIHFVGPPVTLQDIHVGGAFRAEHSVPITVSAGGNTTIELLWCEPPAGDIDDEGLMVIDTNGANGDGSGTVVVHLDRFAAGCR